MLRKFRLFAGEGEDNTFSWWWLGIKFGIITGLVVWWWLDQKNKKQQTFGVDSVVKNDSIPLPLEDPQSASSPLALEQATAQPDNLRKIEGIGPKFQATLQAAGIVTFAQLAEFKPADLKQILVEAGIRLGDPTTWPEQANFAAAGNWDALKEFQSTLKGGRK
jgi:predicted flap endonuclease-1-like 5' DNA nuclease